MTLLITLIHCGGSCAVTHGDCTCAAPPWKGLLKHRHLQALQGPPQAGSCLFQSDKERAAAPPRSSLAAAAADRGFVSPSSISTAEYCDKTCLNLTSSLEPGKWPKRHSLRAVGPVSCKSPFQTPMINASWVLAKSLMSHAALSVSFTPSMNSFPIGRLTTLIPACLRKWGTGLKTSDTLSSCNPTPDCAGPPAQSNLVDLLLMLF